MWRWVWEAEFMNENESWEYWEKHRLDPSKEEDRKLIEEYWLNLNEGDTVEGLKAAAKTDTFK